MRRVFNLACDTSSGRTSPGLFHIVRHRDVFDLQRWMSMARWPLGGVVSESIIRDGAQKKLDEFIAEHPELQDAPAGPHP